MKHKLIVILTLLALICCSTYSQEKDESLEKAKYVIKILESNSIKVITIRSFDFRKAYNSDWISNIRIENGFLCFSWGDQLDCWDIESAIFIEVENGNLNIRLSKPVYKG